MGDAEPDTPTEAAIEAARTRVIDPDETLVNPFEAAGSAPFPATPSSDDIAAAHAYCTELTRREATNFFHSFKYLPSDQRQAIHAVYAFCRRADDIVDGDHAEPVPEGFSQEDPAFVAWRSEVQAGRSPVLEEEALVQRLVQLHHFTVRMESAYGDTWLQDPIFCAWKDTLRRFPIRQQDAREFLRGMEDDLYADRYETFEQLERYCYRVASVVGLMSVEVYGHAGTDAVREAAIAQGQFMQLTNILRDVKEDAARQRVYLPLAELRAHDIDPAHLDGRVLGHPRWPEFVAAYIARVRSYLPQTQALLPLLPKRARYSPAALTAIYERILRVIERRRGDVFTRRAGLSTLQKVMLAARIFVRHRILGRA